MAVALRLARIGRRNRSFFRLRVGDVRFPPNGRFLEELGTFDPIETDPDKQTVLQVDRIRHWLDQGALPSPSVRTLLKKHGIERSGGGAD